MWSQDISAADCKKILINFFFFTVPVYCLILYTLRSASKFSILFSIHFPGYRQRGVILLGEIRSLSLLGVKVLTETNS